MPQGALTSKKIERDLGTKGLERQKRGFEFDQIVYCSENESILVFVIGFYLINLNFNIDHQGKFFHHALDVLAEAREKCTC